MVRFFIFLLSMNFAQFALSQIDLAELKQQEIEEMKVDKNFNAKYRRKLRLLKRTYPMALKAKELIEEYEADLSELSKKRKKKKYGKNAHAELKEQFIYNIRDLYQSEGKMLMKLIHRETGMTVAQIIEKYRGGFQESLHTGIATLWGNDLDATFDPEKEDDWITNLIIQEIENGTIEFDTSMQKMEKKEFKESMKDYRNSKKTTRKTYRNNRRKKRKAN